MFHKKAVKKFICIEMILCLLPGCGYYAPSAADSTSGDTGETEITTLGLTPEFNYEVPKSLPNILVDQLGYAQDSSKIAIFKGELVPDTFSVINAESGREEYTGQIEEKGYDKVTGDYISYGEFTDFNEEGTYYIQAASIGQSYTFCIEDKPYDELFRLALKQYYYNRCGVTLSTEHAGDAAHNACHTKEAQMMSDASVKLNVSGGWHMDKNENRSVTAGCRTINYLLLAYELYSEIFTDDTNIPESRNGIPDILDEVRYEIEWLLKMQDTTSGAVYASVRNVDGGAAGYSLYIDEITMEATIRFAATMAKFSYLYQDYDREFATVCLKASDRAYRYVGKYLDDVAPEEYFFASAELYRATGSYAYHNVVKKYLTGYPVSDMKNDSVFFGCVTYLATKQRVDVNLCNDLIKVLMQDAEQISYNSKNSKFMTNADKDQGNGGELLQSLSRLATVDHIITNHEYATVLQNHLHYFLGRNPSAISYLDGAGSRSYRDIDTGMGIMKQSDLNAMLILMMAAIMEEDSAF